MSVMCQEATLHVTIFCELISPEFDTPDPVVTVKSIVTYWSMLCRNQAGTWRGQGRKAPQA
jgi:hypothetical protein